MLCTPTITVLTMRQFRAEAKIYIITFGAFLAPEATVIILDYGVIPERCVN